MRAPGVLRQSTAVLADVNFTLTFLNPALRALQPVAPLLATLLQKVVPVAQNTIPTIAGVQALVPPAESALRAIPPVEKQATPAVRSLTTSLTELIPILAGLRPYTPGRRRRLLQRRWWRERRCLRRQRPLPPLRTHRAGHGGASLDGMLSIIGPLTGSLGPLNGGRNRLLAPCPGGGGPPAADGSNPWNNPDVLPGTGNLCNPADNQRP